MIRRLLLYFKTKSRVNRHNRHVRLGRKKGVVLKLFYNYCISDKINIVHTPSYNHWIYYQHGIKKRQFELFENYTQGILKIKSTDIVVDVGANTGDFASNILPNVHKVLCIEPDSKVFESLTKNLSHFPNVELLNIAIGPQNMFKTLYSAPDTNDSSFIKSDSLSYETETVEVKRLDLVLKNTGCVKLLKCDAEGFEPEVISSIEGVSDKIDFVSVDCSEERNGESTMNDVRHLLTSFGFSIICDSYLGRKILIAQRNDLT